MENEKKPKTVRRYLYQCMNCVRYEIKSLDYVKCITEFREESESVLIKWDHVIGQRYVNCPVYLK